MLIFSGLLHEVEHLPPTDKLRELHEPHAPVVGLVLCSFLVKLWTGHVLKLLPRSVWDLWRKACHCLHHNLLVGALARRTEHLHGFLLLLTQKHIEVSFNALWHARGHIDNCLLNLRNGHVRDLSSV